jgi:hypothetical protein
LPASAYSTRSALVSTSSFMLSVVLLLLALGLAGAISISRTVRSSTNSQYCLCRSIVLQHFGEESLFSHDLFMQQTPVDLSKWKVKRVANVAPLFRPCEEVPGMKRSENGSAQREWSRNAYATMIVNWMSNSASKLNDQLDPTPPDPKRKWKLLPDMQLGIQTHTYWFITWIKILEIQTSHKYGVPA